MTSSSVARLNHVVRRAAFAAIARLLVGVVKSLLTKGVGRPSRLLAAIGHDWLGGDALKWALVVGNLAMFRQYHTWLLRGVAAIAVVPADTDREARGGGASGAHMLTACLAAMLGGLGMLVMNVQTRTELALFLLVRSLHAIWCAYSQKMLPPTIATFRYYDVMIMCVTGMQIMYGACFAPEHHEPSYRTFLRMHMTYDPRATAAVAGLHQRQIVPAAIDLCTAKSIAPPAHPGDMKAGCAMLHPAHADCNKAFAHFVWRHFTTLSVPLYLPLKVATTVIFTPHRLLSHPWRTVTTMLREAMLSSAFLTLYCAGPYRTVCLFNQLEIRSPAAVSVICGLLAGPATLLEPKARRLELAQFCVMQALRNAWLSNTAPNGLCLPRVNRHWLTGMILAGVASCVLLYEFDRDDTHPSIKSSLHWLMDCDLDRRPPPNASTATADARKTIHRH